MKMLSPHIKGSDFGGSPCMERQGSTTLTNQIWIVAIFILYNLNKYIWLEKKSTKNSKKTYYLLNSYIDNIIKRICRFNEILKSK